MNLYAPAFECVAFFIVSRIFIRGADKCDYRSSSGIGVQYGRLGSLEPKDVYLRIGSLINLTASERWPIDRSTQGKGRRATREAIRAAKRERLLVRFFNGTNQRSMGIDPAVLPLPRIFLKEIHPLRDRAFGFARIGEFRAADLCAAVDLAVMLRVCTNCTKRKSWPARGNRQ